MKRLILLLILITTPFLGNASHIVGGEFELIHISGNTYRLNLVLYFDLHNGAPGARDPSVSTRIFRKSDNAVMATVILPLSGETFVTYSQPACSIGELETSKLIYTSIIELSPLIYNDPMGYYVSWERCCRNYEITNIYSDNPNPDGLPNPFAISAGQTFYLEFPAVVKNGEPFIDSSPKLFPPLSDYACKGKPYYVDFSGTDDDEDSLVYSLVTPLNTHTNRALPISGFPGPRPYPDVDWKPGYSLKKVMQGSPDLAISTEGLLTVTPTKTGLFVFAVKCEEFRNGEKIGETRRDFQMLSVTCKTSAPPVVVGKKLGDNSFSYKDKMDITFPASLPQEDRCIEIQISDPDVNNIFDNNSENIKIRARGVGDKGNVNEVVLPDISSATLNPLNSTATFKICFDECPPVANTPYKIEIITSDDACALPLLDTLRVTVNVQTPANSPARFIKPDQTIIAALREGDPKRDWPVEIVDDDGDLLTVTYFTDGFNLADVGMDFDFTQPIPGTIKDTLSWNPSCDKYDFSVKRNFFITVMADDEDLCSYNIADTARFLLTLIPPPNADPIIDVDITPQYSERIVDGGSVRIYDRVDFNVFGHDDDVGFPISLEALGLGYQLVDYGMQFPGASGSNDVQSHFSWPLECAPFDLSKKDSFNIRFLVIDKNNKCKIYQADTVDVAFKVLAPINSPPEISMTNLHPETTTALGVADSFWDMPIEFLIAGKDSDDSPVDKISIDMINATGNVIPTGYSFNSVSGAKEINSKFVWTPDCSIFQNSIFSNTYQFKFRIYDDHCKSALADTITLTLNVSDYINTDEKFRPLSVITPNGDDQNPYFALDGYDFINPDFDVNLPLDNCLNRFEYINIYNRWGKLVFTSDNRYFKWYAANAGAGVYYYYLKFTNNEYKSSILVRY